MKRKILLVDDHLDDATLITHAMKAAGCEIQIIVAMNGERALELLKTQPFDLLILDINMPGIDGLAMLDLLRKQLQNDVTVIVLTGSNQISHRAHAEALGADDYVVKSTDYRSFETSLTTALSRLNFC